MQIFDARIQQQESGTGTSCATPPWRHQVEDSRPRSDRRPVSGELCEATESGSTPAGRCADEWVLVPDPDRCRADQASTSGHP